jgi:hydrogenase expression/formation protein HypC
MCLAIPGQVLNIEGDDPLMRQGRVAFAGIVKRVNLAYVPGTVVGDYVLVHAGFAIARVDEVEALKTLAYLAEAEPEELR